MKNTNTNEMKNQIKAYLLPIIEDKVEGCKENIPGNPFKWVIETAKKEVPHEFNRRGEQGGLREWLAGLGMGIDFYNSDIIALAEKWHGCTLTEKEAERVVENWFNFISAKILQFSRN